MPDNRYGGVRKPETMLDGTLGPLEISAGLDYRKEAGLFKYIPVYKKITGARASLFLN